MKDKGQLWFSAQKWEQLSQGGLVVPYDEIVDYVRQSLAGSEFTLQSLAYAEPDLLRLELQHTTHGTWSCCCRSRCLMSMPNLLLQG